MIPNPPPIGDGLFAIAEALDRNLTSPNCGDANGEPANVVDGLYHIGDGLFAIAKALSQLGDKTSVDSLGARLDDICVELQQMK